MKNETRQRHPQALLALGEALLAMGELDKALAAFQDVHQRSSRATRPLIGPGCWPPASMPRRASFQQAEALLQENLNGERLTPDSKEWRDSLFALGELLHSQGRYAEAIRRLEEAVERYRRPAAERGGPLPVGRRLPPQRGRRLQSRASRRKRAGGDRDARLRRGAAAFGKGPGRISACRRTPWTAATTAT